MKLPIKVTEVELDEQYVQEDHWSDDGEYMTNKDLTTYNLNSKRLLVEMLAESNVSVNMLDFTDNSITVVITQNNPGDLITY